MHFSSEKSVGSSDSQNRGHDPGKIKNGCSKGISSIKTFAKHLTPRFLPSVTDPFPDLHPVSVEFFQDIKRKLLLPKCLGRGQGTS